MAALADGQAVTRPRNYRASVRRGGTTGVNGRSYGSNVNPGGVRTQTSVKLQDASQPGNYYWGEDPNAQMPGTTPTTQNPYRTTGGGGGGGGGGRPAVDSASILALMNRGPQAYNWQDIDIPEYAGQQFRDFDSSRFDQARQGLDTGLAADLQTGNTAYGEAAAGLSQYQNPYAGGQYSTNPGMSDAMQRMLGANGVQADAATQGQGVQADQAFGNVRALLAGAGQNQQASAARALGGDQRRFQESIQSEGRNMGLSIDMAKAKAMEAYEQEKWQYGEAVAQQNYQARVQEAMVNNTGRNQVGQANTQQTNTFNQGNVQALINLISQGVKIDPAMLQQYMGG